MNNKDLKGKVVSGLLLKYIERVGVQGIQFIVSVILARLLTPEDYGIVAIISVFIALSAVFIQSGFNSSLIQKKEINVVDISSAFFLSLATAILIYILLFFTAPWISRFYSQPILIPAIRVLSVVLILNSINAIQNAIVVRAMAFKKSLYANLSGVIVQGVVGITMALNGYGVWSLIFSQLSGQIAICIAFVFVVRWKPVTAFSMNNIKAIYGFGSKIMAIEFLNYLFRYGYSLIIGKIYDGATLGYYNRAYSFPNLVASNINTTIATVMLSAFSSKQDDLTKIHSMLRRAIKTSTYFMFPALFGMAIVGEPLIQVLLTEKWLSCVPYLQLSCILFAFMPLHIFDQAITSIGRSDILLKLGIIKKVITVISLIITVPISVEAMIIGLIVTELLASLINAFANRRFFSYLYSEQLSDILPALVLSIAMCMTISLFTLINMTAWVLLICQIIAGVVFYVVVSRLLKIDSYFYIKDILITSLKPRKQKSQ
jgi:teichuronic acid exporter